MRRRTTAAACELELYPHLVAVRIVPLEAPIDVQESESFTVGCSNGRNRRIPNRRLLKTAGRHVINEYDETLKNPIQ